MNRNINKDVVIEVEVVPKRKKSYNQKRSVELLWEQFLIYKGVY